MSSGKATVGITVVNSALGFFSSDFPPHFGFKPRVSRTAVSAKKWDCALELAHHPRPVLRRG